MSEYTLKYSSLERLKARVLDRLSSSTIGFAHLAVLVRRDYHEADKATQTNRDRHVKPTRTLQVSNLVVDFSNVRTSSRSPHEIVVGWHARRGFIVS